MQRNLKATIRKVGEVEMGLTERHFFEYEDVPERYEWDLEDALALRKEQEAVKPVPPEDEFSLYRCGKCYHQLFRCVDKYCSRCGQAVKWDDI